MARNSTFEQFKGDLTEADIQNLIQLAKKKRTKYIVGFLISYACLIVITLISTRIDIGSWLFTVVYILNLAGAISFGIFAGLGCYANNVIAFLTSRGRRDGGGLGSIIWALIGGLIIPLIVIFVCNKSMPKKVLGWDKTDITFTRL